MFAAAMPLTFTGSLWHNYGRMKTEVEWVNPVSPVK